MKIRLASLAHCAAVAGLQPHEMVAGVMPTAKHERMFQRYRCQSSATAQGRLVAEIRDALAIGAATRAGDLLILLRWAIATPQPVGQPSRRRRRMPIRLARKAWLNPVATVAERETREAVVTPLFESAKP